MLADNQGSGHSPFHVTNDPRVLQMSQWIKALAAKSGNKVKSLGPMW